MPATDPRYRLADVTDESREGWRSFTRRYGANPTALAEVIGLSLGQIRGELPALLQQWVDDAVALEDRRRSRSAD